MGSVSSNEAYNPVTNDWTERAPMPTARHHHASAVVDGKIYIIGGRETGIGSNTDRNEMYDPGLDTWTVLSPMPTKRSGLSASSIGNQVFAMGGQNEIGGFDLNEKYDTATDSWTIETPLPNPRLGHDTVTYEDKIYVRGKTSLPQETATEKTEIFMNKDDSEN